MNAWTVRMGMGVQPRLLIATTVPATLRSFLLPVAAHFVARGWSVDGMARDVSACPECTAAFRRTWDVDWSRNPLDLPNLVRAPGQVRTVVEREGYDLVHVHTPVAGFVTRYALRRLRQSGRPRVIYTAHGFHFYRSGPALRNAVFRSLEQFAGRWTDYLVVLNREDEAAARRYRIVQASRVVYMPGIGVDTGRFNPERVAAADVDSLRVSLGLSPGQPLFTMVGEFIPRKRHRDVLLAFSKLQSSAAHLALAGDGPLVGQMRELARQLSVANRVHFLGYRRDISVLMRASVAVLLFSVREGLPVCVMEALSLGVPVVGTAIRGTRDLLADGCGILTPPGDVEQMTQALTWILDHPAEGTAMGRRGRVRMREVCDRAAVLRLHENLYARALGDERLAADECAQEGQTWHDGSSAGSTSW